MASTPSDALEVKTELTAPVDAECQQVSPSVPEQADKTGGIKSDSAPFGQRIAEQIEAQNIVIQRKQRSVGVHLTVSGLKRRENIGVRQIQQRNEVQHTSNQKGKRQSLSEENIRSFV